MGSLYMAGRSPLVETSYLPICDPLQELFLGSRNRSDGATTGHDDPFAAHQGLAFVAQGLAMAHPLPCASNAELLERLAGAGPHGAAPHDPEPETVALHCVSP